MSLSSALSTADVFVWCAENDPCPLDIFHALYFGVHVLIFEKHYQFGLQTVNSDLDGTALLRICKGTPQHAPLHTLGKNSKKHEDVLKARQYVQSVVGDPPQKLIEFLLLNEKLKLTSGIDAKDGQQHGKSHDEHRISTDVDGQSRDDQQRCD
jgi:hypothetical protein